jgi:hypothetical protein
MAIRVPHAHLDLISPQAGLKPELHEEPAGVHASACLFFSEKNEKRLCPGDLQAIAFIINGSSIDQGFWSGGYSAEEADDFVT